MNPKEEKEAAFVSIDFINSNEKEAASVPIYVMNLKEAASVRLVRRHKT
jgi:hypothetical protein